MLKWKGSPKFSFFILCFAAFLDWMSYGLVYPMFAISLFNKDPIFLAATSNALKGVWLGVLLAASPLGQFFASPLIGAISDQIGRKRTLQITYLIIIAGYLISAWGIWIPNFFILILGRVVTGIGAGNLAVINSAVADISQPHAKAKNFALVTMSSGLGFVAGPFIGGKLSAFGFDIPFIFAGLVTLMTFFFFSFLFSETKKESEKTSFASRLQHLVKMVGLPKFRVLFSAFFIFCFGWSFYWEFIPVTWIKDFGLNASQIGNFYAYGSVFYVLSTGLLIRPIIKKFKAMPILIWAWLALGLCFFFLLHEKVWLFWVGIPLQQFLIALVFPVGTALVSNATSENRQGEMLGAFQSLQSFAFAMTPFLGGILLDVSSDMPLIVSGIGMLVACLILWLGYRQKHVLSIKK